jgi:hypothetical protein
MYTLHIHTAHAALRISTASRDGRLHVPRGGCVVADTTHAILHAQRLDAAWEWHGGRTSGMR